MGQLSTLCMQRLRAKRAEEAVEHLRTDADSASQRATSAEVKLQVLQKAVQQAEERAATLEMQVCPNIMLYYECSTLMC